MNDFNAYLLYFLFFTPHVLFNSGARSWIFDPLIRPDGKDVMVSESPKNIEPPVILLLGCLG